MRLNFLSLASESGTGGNGGASMAHATGVLVLSLLLVAGDPAFAVEKRTSPLVTRRAVSIAAPRTQTPAQSPDGGDENTQGENTPDSTAPVEPPVSPVKSPYIEQTVAAYKAEPGGPAWAQVMEAVRALLATPAATRVSPAVLVKENPGLQEFKPSVTDAAGARLWLFPRGPERHHIILQWPEVKQQVTGVGRRQKVVTTVTPHAVRMMLPPQVTVKGASFSGKEAGRRLILSGDGEDGALWIMAYRPVEGSWAPAPEFVQGLPEFLRKNVCGSVQSRTSTGELIFNIGRMVEQEIAGGGKRFLPEAESSTYRFILHPSDSGFVVVPGIANIETFATVQSFMTSVSQSRPDRSLLSDGRLSAIPKYLGLQGKPVDPQARVVEMKMPPGKGSRFRLISIGKDDLIFDIAKVKGVNQIRAIFVAPPDPFLVETARYFPTYAKLTEAPAPPQSGATTGDGTKNGKPGEKEIPKSRKPG